MIGQGADRVTAGLPLGVAVGPTTPSALGQLSHNMPHFPHSGPSPVFPSETQDTSELSPSPPLISGALGDPRGAG